MKRKISLAVSGFAALVTAFGMTACADKTPKVPEHVHEYVETVVAATCTEGGYTLHKCVDGDDSYRSDKTAPLGHDYSVCDRLNDEAHRLSCSRCGDFKPTQDYDEHVMKPFGTGVKCADCGFTVTDADCTIAYEHVASGAGYIVTGYEGNDSVIVIPEKHEGEPVVGIKAGALATNQSWIRNLVLPASLEYIETGALSNFRVNRAFFRGTVAQWCEVEFGDEKSNPFYRCASGELWIGGELITDLAVPEGVTEIGELTFAGCGGVESVELPSTLIAIGDKAFYECTGIKTVTLPENLAELSQTAFDGCTIDEFVSQSNKYVMKNYCLIETDTKTLIRATSVLSTIPEDGSVEKIGASAFYGLDIKSVTVPSCVTEIGARAFMYCGKLRGVKIMTNANNVVPLDIGDYAFNSCYSLTQMSIPARVSKIGKVAFGYCSKLTSVKLSIGLTESVFTNGMFPTYSDSSFVYCTNLFEVYNSTGLTMTAGNKDKFGGVCAYAKNIYTTLSAESKIKTDADGFEYYAGDETLLLGYTGDKTALTLPEKLGGKDYAICARAFYASDLRSVTVPAGVTSIGGLAFAASEKLTSATVKSNVTGASMFDGCVALESAVFTGSPTALADTIFQNCTALESITIPDTVRSIGSLAFGGCTALSYAKLPSALESIGQNAFKGCTALKSVDLPEGLTTLYNGAFYGSGLVTLKTPSSLTEIPANAFKDCEYLVSVELTNVTGLDVGVFSGCKSLKTVKADKVTGGLSERPDKAGNWFEYCTSLEEISLPEAVLIGEKTFYGCTALKRVEIPKVRSVSVQYAGSRDYAFYNCDALEYADISGMESVPDYEFYNCISLDTVVLGENLTTIGEFAFCYCKIADLIIPASVTSIGQQILRYNSEPAEIPQIWCYAEEQPQGFADYWDFVYSGGVYANVHWGGTWDMVNGAPVAKQ